jgi:hypothetical protein
MAEAVVRLNSKKIFGVLAVALAASAPLLPQEESPYGDHPRLGGGVGSLRSKIVRGPSEEVQPPDVLTLKGGQRVEAYFLNVYGDRLVYYVKETDRSWLREETLRSEVETIDFQQYLDKDPVAPRKVERARKQPARKLDLLSGVFRGQIGRDTYWTLSFQSELDKYLEFSEDATDYGTIEIETSYLQRVEEGLPPSLLPRGSTQGGKTEYYRWPRSRFARSHEVHAVGKYYLFAPGSIANDDWVLTVAGVIQSEVDHGRDTSLFTTEVPDETFMLYFNPEKSTFRLEWSNVGGWTWTSLVGPEFVRLPRARPLIEDDLVLPPQETLPPRTPVRFQRTDGKQEFARDAAQGLPEAKEPSRSPSDRSPSDRDRGAGLGRTRTSSALVWKTDSWRQPQYRLGTR